MKRTATNQETKNLVKHIIQLAMEVSKETEHDVFVEYMPHVDLLECRLFIDGWESGGTGTYEEAHLEEALINEQLVAYGEYLAALLGGESKPCTQA